MKRNKMKCSKPSQSSEDLFKKASQILPGGVSRNTVFRQPYPSYAATASGCYVTDIDGIERIDFANNMASLIHGHTHPDVIKAVTEQLHKGTAYTMATEAEISLAQLLCDRVNGFEKIRFVNSGTEAVMTMIKASRAYTGKSKIAKAEGTYHGTYDYAEVSQTSNPTNWGNIDKPNSVALVKGTPKDVLNDVIIFPYNDPQRTITILDQHADELACVLLDPIPHRVGLIPGTNEFIETLYKWTRKNNTLLIFDEVITFRTNYGGAQENYNIQPDLTTLGKIIGGGFPVGAIAGRSDVMKVFDPSEKNLLFPHSGTFSANPITMTAGRITMELFDKDAVLKLNKLANKAIQQIEQAIQIADISACVTGSGSMYRIHLKSKAPNTYREAWMDENTSQLINKLLDHLYQQGIMMINTCSCTFSTVMTQKEIDRLSEAMLSAFRAIKPTMEKTL